jgi:hypothetical protein
MEWFAQFAPNITQVMSAVALLIAPISAIFIFQQLSPIAQIRISVRWVDLSSGRFVLRIEVENISRVRIRHKVALLQVLRYSLLKTNRLSEWVPFAKDQVIKGEEPIEWKEPEDIFGSTVHLYPREVISVERLEQIEDPNEFLHVGVQYNSRFAFRWLFTFLLGWHERWTTTAIVSRPETKWPSLAQRLRVWHRWCKYGHEARGRGLAAVIGHKL